MFIAILKMLFMTMLQNAAFTWVSRARNGKSYKKHAIAAVGSNGLYILVLKHVVVNIDTWYLMVTYVVGTVLGSVGMHFISMNYLEKDGFKWKEMWDDFKQFISRIKVLIPKSNTKIAEVKV